MAAFSFQIPKFLLDAPDFEDMKIFRLIAQRPRRPVSFFARPATTTNTSSKTLRHSNFLTRFLPCPVPALQHADAAAHGGGMVEHELFEHFKFLVAAIFDPGQNLQHLVRMGQPEKAAMTQYDMVPTKSKSSNDSCVSTVQANDAATETASSSSSLFGSSPNVSSTSACRTKNSRPLELLHNGLAGFRPTAPVGVPQRVTVPIFAERDKLLAPPDVCGERHATLLVTQRTRQRDGRR